MDEAGFATAHIAGNSLGGFLALQLAARGRAESVVALAPAGGWARTDDSFTGTAEYFADSLAEAEAAAPHADEIVSTPEGRRRATQSFATNFEHIPAELLAHMLRGVAACHGARTMIDYALRAGYELDAAKITCPVRIVWGTDDQLLRGRRRRCASARSGCRTPTGSSSTGSGTAPSSTSRSRRRS